MAEAASLKLLKGGNKAALAKELEEKEPVTVAEETEAEDVVVDLSIEDIQKMDAKAIDNLMAEHEIDKPDGWAKMKIADKRAWLIAQFDEAEGEEGEAAEEEQEEEAQPEPEPVAEEKPKGKVSFGKKKAPTTPVEEEVEEAEVVEEKPAKKASKGKGITKSSAKSGEVMEKNALSDIGVEIENLSEEDAKALVGRLAEEVDQTFFKLGGVLSRILEHQWYKPYASFREYVEQEHDITYRTAMYWINIYTSLIEAEIPYDKVAGIGWSKLKELASILTADNVDEWVKKAKKLNVPQLANLIAQTKKEAAAGENEGATPSSNAASNIISTKTFKLHADQKETVEAAIEKAKKEGNTDTDTVALEYICLQYLNAKPVKGKAAPVTEKVLKDEIKKLGAESALEMVAELFPDVEIEANFGDAAE